MFNDSNLYEREYEDICNVLNRQKVSFWEKLIGINSINYVIEKWPNILKEKSKFVVKYLDSDYEMMKKYYTSHYIELNKDIVEWFGDKNFGCFFVDLLTLAYSAIKQKDNKDEILFLDDVIKDYLNEIYKKLIFISIRSLIIEMNMWNERNSIIGTPEELYQIYCKKYLNDRKYRLEFYEKYPVVFRSVLETIIFGVDNFKLFFTRLKKDKVKIEKEFCYGRKITKVTQLKSDLADSHCRGNNVFRVKFDTGITIVYKAHSIINEIIYQEIEAWFGIKCSLKMFLYKYIDQKEYGWVEYIYSKACKTPNEVQRYYSRIGIHIFICYMLNSTDIHAENLVAYGEYPVIIDMETITSPFSNQNLEYFDLDEKINRIIQRSVLHSGLLPFYIWSQDKKSGIDVSAINGKPRQIIPFKIPSIKNPFRVDMKVEYINASYNFNCNLVRLGTKVISVVDYKKMVIKGFRDAYEVALKHHTEIISFINKISNEKIRFVIRNSQQYDMLLSSSFHPKLTRDEADHQIYFYGLYSINENCTEEILDAEVRDLLQNDIPYFYFFPIKKDLYDSRNNKIANFFEQDVNTQLLNYFSFMNKNDLKRQISFIDISIGMICYPEMKRKANVSFYIQREKNVLGNSINEAMKYGEFLLNTAIYDDTKTNVNWIGIKVHDSNIRDWHMIPLNIYFYEGKGGITIFLHILKCENPQRYKKICDILDRSYFMHTDEMLRAHNEKVINIGAYSGEASILYLYELCYKLFRKNVYMEYCEKQVQIIKNHFEKDKMFDFLSGNAGAIIVIIHMYDMTNNVDYLKLAIKMGEYLLKYSIKMKHGIGWNSSNNATCLAGLAHGNSGFALAFSYLYARSKDKKYLKVIRDILEYENSLYSSDIANWKDLRADKEGSADIVTWCHGAAGILLSRIKIYELLKNTSLEQTILIDINKAVRKTMSKPLINGNCLCHGNLGNILILLEYGRRMNCSISKNKADYWYNIILKLLHESNKSEFISEFEKYNQSIMIGGAGLYYALLKYNTNFLPNILLLEI